MGESLNHIAFIPDGNRRYAKEQGLSPLEGHTLGYERFKQVVSWCHEMGIKELTFWGFSTENWKRSKEEVGYLMDLFVRMLARDLAQLAKDGIRIRIIGRRSDLPANVQNAIDRAEEETKHCTSHIVNVLFNYGGRAELLDATKAALAVGISSEALTEEALKSFMWSHEMTDPDLVVRTSGEQRLSGFLPWGAVYAELYFLNKYWPAFERSDLETIVQWFTGRERRFGGNGTSAQ